MVARVTRLVAEKFVLSTFPRALTTLSSMCSRAVRALESSPGLIMMMDRREEVDRGEHSLMTDPGCAAQNDDVRHAWSRIHSALRQQRRAHLAMAGRARTDLCTNAHQTMYDCSVRWGKRKRETERGTSPLRKVILTGLDQP